MNHILILGSKGMLGQELVRVFSGDGKYEVTAWDKEDIDITDERSVRAKVTDLWPDVIVNAAAYNAVDLCEAKDDEYERARALNAKAPGVLADIANDLQATIVHFSTDYVFDGERPRHREEGKRAPGCCGSGCDGCSYNGSDEEFDGYREWDMPNPLSRYGKTKYEGELAVEKATPNHYIIRLAKLFGRPGAAEGAKQSFFDVMLERGRDGVEVMVIDGEMGNFTYAPDLAQVTRSLIEENSAFGIYHLVNEGVFSWYAACGELYRQANIATKIIPVPPKHFPRPAPRPACSALVNTKREKLRPLTEAIGEYLKEQ